MSKSSESDFDLELHFLPAWAQKPAAENRYAQYAGEPERDFSRRPERRGRGPQGRPQQGRPPGGGGAPRRQGGGRPGEGGAGPQGQRGPRRFEGRRPEGRRPDRERRPPPPQPLPEINVTFVPDDKGVDSLARQIRMTGRAYPLFEIAQMVLQKPDRYSVTLTTRKSPEGTPIEKLYQCALDETAWLSEEDAVRWVLERHFETFYQPEKTQIDPPKGTYTFVAQCGMSGTILGPPNYHDYQNRLRKLHSERFSNMPFEVYKSRVKIVRDEAVVKQWLDEQSWRTEYVCLNLPDPLKLSSREEVERHFREVHLANIIKEVETLRLSGVASRALRSAALSRLVRENWENQRHFPIQVATVLSQQFATRGLQFFKVNRTVTHVSVSRPHFLDMEATPVSEGVRKIVEFINAHSKCTRHDLVIALAPMPARPIPVAPPPAPEAVATTEPVPADQAAAPAEGSTEAAAAPPPPAPPAELEPTPEQTAVVADLHWLIHQGHVIEFANGVLETAKKPIIKPPKPQPQPKAPEAEGQAQSAEAVAPSQETPGVAESADATTSFEASAEQPAVTPSPTPEPEALPRQTAEAVLGETPPAEASSSPEPAPETVTTEENRPKPEQPL